MRTTWTRWTSRCPAGRPRGSGCSPWIWSPGGPPPSLSVVKLVASERRAKPAVTDFVKLIIYTAFFCVLFTFYGLPIHIMRDWFMTTRSFLKRLSALIRYRQALKDMDQYPDATA